MKKIFFFSLILIGFLYSENLTRFVNPFIGTGGHGHTFPGATMPFGMVQLSPDTDIQGWDWCSGYHFSDQSLMGFSHTHLSGTGGADYGDILLMPVTGDIKWQPGSKENPDEGYRSRFTHEKESARPGYYQVFLDDYKVNVELTSSKRVGFHKYTFPKNDDSHILIDLRHGISDIVTESYITVVSETEIEGLRRSHGWASDQYVYFVIKFSKPAAHFTIAKDDKHVKGKKAEGKNIKGLFSFKTVENEVIYAKVAISAVSIEGARKNLEAEIPAWDFENIVVQADKEWNTWLNKINVQSNSSDEKTIFYTAFYHSLIAPNLFMDVDGKYRGRDHEIYVADGFNYYSLFSLWDTFRATHPLFTLIAPKYNSDFIKTMIKQFEQGGDLPIWELAANETGTMIGYHSIPVIADAYLKGQDNFNIEKAFAAMKHSSMKNDRGLKQYRDLGYIPSDQEVNSVSKCVEYAYDDWCIAQMAKKLDKKDEYQKYIKRSQNYINHFDPDTKFMRGKMSSGLWRPQFDPRQVSHLGNADFTEGNSWQYTFFVPHNVNHLIELTGGETAFINKLDKLFNESVLLDLEHSPDVSGLIGNYAHGNEPSHHISYLYNYTSQPWKTQHRVNQIKTDLYSNNVDGLAGNEDCGQMSAWYLFSAIGFYPVSPGQNEYIIGSPSFDKITLKLENGKNFIVSANNNSEKNYYIQEAKINNKLYSRNYITHQDIEEGAVLEFEMGNSPNKNWANKIINRARSFVIEDEYKIKRVEETRALSPYTEDEETLFGYSKLIALNTITPNAQIRYTLDGSIPNKSSTLYKKPITLKSTTKLKAVSFGNELQPSAIFERDYIKIGLTNSSIKSISLKHKPDPRYDEGGKLTLLDNVVGSLNFHDGKWLGFEEYDLEAIIEFEKDIDISGISTRFLQGHGSWVFLPENIKCFGSKDGSTFEMLGEVILTAPTEQLEDKIENVELSFEKKNIRYLKVFAKNIRKNPSWHGSPDGKSWIFCDEIMISAAGN